MVWGAVIGGLTAAYGASQASKGSDDAAEASKEAAKTAAKMDQKVLDFEKQRYDDWLGVYGPIQKNLADYYSNVSAEYYEVQGLEAFEKERDIQMGAVQRNLAQRGISDSGIAINIERQEALDAAETRAGIRVEAPRKAAAEKASFLQIGLGQDPSGDLSQALQNQSTTARNAATTAELRSQQAQEMEGRAVGTAISTIGTSIGSGLDNYYQNKETKDVSGEWV